MHCTQNNYVVYVSMMSFVLIRLEHYINLFLQLQLQTQQKYSIDHVHLCNLYANAFL